MLYGDWQVMCTHLGLEAELEISAATQMVPIFSYQLHHVVIFEVLILMLFC